MKKINSQESNIVHYYLGLIIVYDYCKAQGVKKYVPYSIGIFNLI